MSLEEIIDFLKKNIEPLEDNIYGQKFRASVYLKDNTYLPCVVFQSSENLTKLALKRFNQERKNNFLSKKNNKEYIDIVSHFVTTGNKVNYYDIKK